MRRKEHTYFLQQLALKPLLEKHSPDFPVSYQRMEFDEKEALAALIETNFLGPMWLEVVGKDTVDRIWSKEWREQLQQQYRAVSLCYVNQLKAIRSLTRVLDDSSIDNAVFKGAHTREMAYSHPTARPSGDIDLLILEKDKERAIEALQEQGFRLSVNPDNISHEVSLVRKPVDLDLHWHIMRPGRIPTSLTNELLARRIRQNGYWSLSNEDNLFILLTHPIFTKYAALTRSSLLLFLDLFFWFQQPMNWARLHFLLEKTGVKTAAWMMFEYYSVIAGAIPKAACVENLVPTPWRRWYLRQWVYKDLASRFSKTPFIPKLLFTLFAHDSLRDASSFLYDLTVLPMGSKIATKEK